MLLSKLPASFKIIDIIILFSFLSIGFIPFFKTVDIIGSQWFYLSLINICFLLYNFSKGAFINFILRFSKHMPFKFFLFFYLFVFISLFYTHNFNLSLVDFSRISIVLISIVNLSYFFSSRRLSLLSFSYCVSIILFLEIVYSFLPLLSFFVFESDSFSDLDLNQLAFSLKGVAGNKNIMASNLSFKLPFLFYLIYKAPSFHKIIFSLLLSLALILIYLISARATYISSILVSFFFISYFIYYKLKSNFSLSFYLFSPIIILFILVGYIVSIDSKNDSNSKLTSLTIIDESSNNRVILYENAIDYISKNPLIGCGIGNWKVESLPYWKDLMSGYMVPYHAHNDFLELGTEIGILGALSYLFIFIFIFLSSLRSFYLSKDIFPVLLFSLTTVYFIDAFLNFPLERALSQVNFIILMVLFYLKPSFNENPSS